MDIRVELLEAGMGVCVTFPLGSMGHGRRFPVMGIEPTVIHTLPGWMQAMKPLGHGSAEESRSASFSFKDCKSCYIIAFNVVVVSIIYFKFGHSLSFPIIHAPAAKCAHLGHTSDLPRPSSARSNC